MHIAYGSSQSTSADQRLLSTEQRWKIISFGQQKLKKGCSARSFSVMNKADSQKVKSD